MKALSINSVKSITHFFYPSYCLHCEGTVAKPHHLLCSSCFEQIEPIDPKSRCPICWGPSPCKPCAKKPTPLRPHRSLFEPYGPILPLYQEFLKTKRAKTLASLIVMALVHTSWPLPDMIVPQVTPPFPKEDPLFILAKSVGKFLERPVSLPHERIQDKKVLLLNGAIRSAKEVVEGRRLLYTFFPQKVYSFALLDCR
ncbi:hypothetical protein [Candidatus Neptunochlamydia vexilliferae]|uniref:hypothetical protein n=1 Tax=Candidatus Neptunichlamydia vexilliferae TaxID=1651774 RepID=UPI00189172E5|nr:hypothetical protein [Candidatus Neptunochlamydia vexilliferae]